MECWAGPLSRVADSQSDFICKSDCFLTSDLAELAGGLRQGRVHQNACRITQISDFNIQWETSQISRMTSQPMGIEDFLVIDGAMSQQNFPEYSIPFYQSHQKHKWRVIMRRYRLSLYLCLWPKLVLPQVTKFGKKFAHLNLSIVFS